MRVLVTGGGGVIGQALLPALLRAGHEVRLFTRHAGEQAREWPEGVEPWEGDVGDARTVQGSADGCAAIVHVAGIAREKRPEATFQRVNVDGTRHVVAEALRSGRPRLIYVSSLGAERGRSGYHRSKHDGEKIVREYAGDWRIVRPGNVYGPGDELISALLTMVRTLPAIPVIDGGDQPFQPIWTDDLAEALSALVGHFATDERVLEVAGADIVTVNSLLDELAIITGRSPARVPVPGIVAALGSRVASWLGTDLPVSEDTLTMLAEENVIRAPARNALPDLTGRAPTPVAVGLRRLADSLPLRIPTEGVGEILEKRFRADVHASHLSAEGLVERVRTKLPDMMPRIVRVGAEPGSKSEIRLGETLTLAIPLRGNIQVRCVEQEPGALTLVTVSGHPLAAAVRLVCAPLGDGEPRPGEIRVEIQVFEQAATRADWLTMLLGGEAIQEAVWKECVRRIVRESGGVARGGIRQESERLDDRAAERAAGWLRAAVTKEKRREYESRSQSPRR